ncbi:MAG: biopolymer transporter ExbD [Gammaproteobacteria bacterium]|nr:biopolymer transporter ExbD [Gammaproteobacteria bacterium]
MRRRFRRRPAESELNITSYMNLMVILVPFLLISAVFSQSTILQLNLPQVEAADDVRERPTLQLELILRGNELIINNAADKPLERLPGTVGGVDTQALSDTLYRLKRRYPEHTEIALLLEPGTEYQTLITLMDTVRSKRVSSGVTSVEVELFPQISIGDAPGSGQRAAH